MAIISLSLSSLIKAIIIPNMTINGNITLIKLGIKNIDKFKISKNLTWKLLKYENSLEIWSNQAIDTKIKKTSVQDLNIWIKTYWFIFFIMTFKIEYPSKLTSNNKDIVIFVSNLSQLKNSEFLPDSDFYLKSNQIIKQINSKNYFLLQNIKKNNSLLNIMVVLLKSSKNSN